MPGQKTKMAPPPRWAWLFAAACIAIPIIAIGGAIPSAIGAAGAFYCLAVARETKKSTRGRLIHCAAVTAGCWVLFIGFAGGVMALRSNTPAASQMTRSQPASTAQTAAQIGIDQRAAEIQQDVMANEEKRREIYLMAVGLRDDLERVKARKADRIAKGLDVTVSDRQIAHVDQMQKKHIDFTARFHKITRQQLDEIIAEGDRKGWPQE
jgi:hypothetical protein